MKRTVGLVLSFIMLFAFSKAAHATTTILLGRNTNSHGEIKFNGASDSGSMDDYLISLSYVKKIKLVITDQFGDFYGNSGKEHVNFLDIQVGYPLVSEKEGILYFTLTGFKYTGYLNYSAPYITKHEADGGLAGLEIVGFSDDKIQIEFGWQRAIGGSYRISHYNSSLDLTLIQLKLKYLLTDNLGLVFYSQLKDFDSKSASLNLSEKINTTVVGIIYRL